MKKFTIIKCHTGVRIEIAGDGSVVEIKTLNNVKWSDVLNLIF